MPNIQPNLTTNPYAFGAPCPIQLQPCTVNNNYRLKVSGKGTIYTSPDKVIVVLGVITENVQLETAQRENGEKVASVIQTLLTLGVQRDAIQTQTYNIQPVYDYIDGKQVFKEYMVTHNLRIEIRNVGMVGEIIDSAVRAGANNVSSINFTLSDPSPFYKEALNAAVSDAISKAETIGARLKVHVFPVPVQVVEEAYHQGMPPQPLYMQASGQSTPIQPGQIEITASIEAIFSYALR